MSTLFIITYCYFCALILANIVLLIFHFRSRLETFYCRLAYQQKLVITFFSFRSKKPKTNQAVFVARKYYDEMLCKIAWRQLEKAILSVFVLLIQIETFRDISRKLCPMFFSVHHSIFFEFAWIKMLIVSFGSFDWFFLFKLVLSFFFHKIILF